jgi:hypothetical protein
VGHKEFLAHFSAAQRKIFRKKTRHSVGCTVRPTMSEPNQFQFFDELEAYCGGASNDSSPIVCVVKETWAEFPSGDFMDWRKKGPNPFVMSTTNRNKEMPMALHVKLEVVHTTIHIEAGAGAGPSTNHKRATPSFLFGFQLFPSTRPFLVPLFWTCSRREKVVPGSHIKRKKTLLHPLMQRGEVLFVQDGRVLPPFDDEQKNTGDSNNEETATKSSYCELPEWNGVQVKWDDGTTGTVNAWEVSVEQVSNMIDLEGSRSRTRRDTAGSTENTLPDTCKLGILDIDLRSEVEQVLRKAARLHEAAEPFLEDVTEDVAPGYFAFVPIGMSVRKMLKRLKIDSTKRGDAGDDSLSILCYYRSIQSMLEDLRDIYANCVLYNQAESDIVYECRSFVEHVAEAILHNETAFQSRKEHLQQDEQKSNSESKHKEKKSQEISINTKWLLQHHPDKSWDQSSNRADMASWTPQVGDRVYYSSKLHHTFLSVHNLGQDHSVAASNEANHDSSEADTTSLNDWTLALITRAQPVFAPPTQSEDNSPYDGVVQNNKFHETSTVLRIIMSVDPLGSNSNSSGDGGSASASAGASLLPKSLLWRPCFIPSTKSKSEGRTCDCGFPATLFLKPAWFPKDNMYSAVHGVHAPSGLDGTTVMQKIYPLLQHLRFRCQEGVQPDMVDTNITSHVLGVAGQQQHPPPPSTSTRKVVASTSSAAYGGGGVKSGVSSSSTGLDQPKPLHAYFSLPSRKGKAFAFSPAPTLCLDLVMLRIQHGFYRQLEGAIADVNEAFLLLALHVLGVESAAKLLRSRHKPIHPHVDHTTDPNRSITITAKERYEFVRKVYSTALLCFCRSALTEKAFGVFTPGDLKRVVIRPTKQEKDLKRLIAALGKDRKDNYRKISPRDPHPSIKVTLRIAGEILKADATDDEEVTNNSDKEHLAEQEEINDEHKTEQDSDPVPTSTLEGQAAEDKETSQLLSLPTAGDTIAGGLVLTPDVYEKNSKLVRVLFGKLGRKTSCARCQVVGKQPFITCRVRHRHSNPSLTRKELDAEGTLGKLLQKYYATTNESFPFSARHHVQGMTAAESEQNNTKTVVPKPQNPVSTNGRMVDASALGTACNMGESAATKDTINSAPVSFDANQILEMANRAYKLAEQMHKEANAATDAPVKLSDRFIKAAFPVDPVDNHYTLCCVCGYGTCMLCYCIRKDLV